VPLNQAANSPDRVGFERVALGMSPDQIGRYWIDRKIRGQSRAPSSVSSPELLARAVSRIPGTIGYLRTGDLRPDLRVISIDGKRPADPGYRVEY
jgi:hypothetical protein